MNFTDFPITHIINHRLRKINWFFPFTTYYRITLLIVRSKRFLFSSSFFLLLNLKKKRIYLSFALFPLSLSLLLTLVSQLHHTRVRVLGKAYSKRRWRTIRERERENERERERETRCGLRVLSCACLFIYFCSGLCALYTLDSLSRFPSPSLIYKQTDFRQQQAKEKEDEDEENEEEKRIAGRRIRKELSSVVVVLLD